MDSSQASHEDLNAHALSATQVFRDSLKARFKAFYEVAAVSSIVNILALVSSFFAMQVYDRVIPNNAISTLWVLFSGVVLSAFLEAGLRILRTHMLDTTSKGLELELSQRFFNKALSIRMDARPQTVGTFASQVRDFDSVKSFLSSTTLYVISDMPFALLFLGVFGAYWRAHCTDTADGPALVHGHRLLYTSPLGQTVCFKRKRVSH